MTEGSLSSAFGRASDGALEQRLAALVLRGQTAWPKLRVDPSAFVAFLGRRAKKAPDLTDFPHIEDLFLTHACVAGAPGALRAFEDAHFASLPSHLAQLAPTRDFLADAEQTLRTKLFVAKEGKEMGLAAYSGSGPLGAWFRVTALNTALKMLRAETQNRAREAPLGASPSRANPESELIRARTQAELGEILKRVLAQAPARERALLRMHFVDGSTLEELAQVFEVHRGTVVRWIRAARRSILEETQRQMTERLQLSPSELSSTFRMSRTDWSLSLETALGPEKKKRS
jgi:RNA polymerase sigma-70 factor (ECF subfamily)